MPTNGSNSASSSVSPKVIVPSVTVISLLVLITFIGAVIIFVRAYKKRRRRSSDVEKQDVEAGQAGERGVGNRERRESMMKSGMGPPRAFGRSGGAIRPPPRAARRESQTLPQEAREIVNQEFKKGRSGKEGAERTVAAGQGYAVRHAHETRGTEIHESSGVPAVPIIGKIERITGNALSNDFYGERASGSGHSRSNCANTAREAREPKRHSYPLLSTKNVAPGPSSSRPLTLNTNLSPISPETDISTARDFSPYSEHTAVFKSLSPPPAAPNAIALKYPNVTALVRANSSAESSKRSSSRLSNRSSNRFSYTQMYSGTNLAEHISTQYNRFKEPRKSPQTPPKDAVPPVRVPEPPLSAAFGGFTISRKPTRLARVSSASTEITSSIKEVEKSHVHRISWSGRSVLELDAPSPSNQYTPSLPLPPPSKPYISKRTDRNLPPEPAVPPKFATSPRVRTSAFGSRRHKDYPPLPPIPPDLSDIAGGPGELILPTLMSRSASNSKMSVVSVPSTISSFNTITGRAPIGGLSPTPARHSLRNTPDYEDVASINRKSVGGSTVLTETSEISNMTEAELEMEMRRIRERARRASDERRGTRRRNEEKQSSREAEGGDNPGIGHRLF